MFGRKLLIAIAACLLLSACAQTGQDTIKIGAVLSLSGPAAAYGDASRQAIDLAVQEINAGGGINGKELVVVYEDDHTNAQQAVSAFQKVANIDGVAAVIGGTWDFN